jgi:hypothetical protein
MRKWILVGFVFLTTVASADTVWSGCPYSVPEGGSVRLTASRSDLMFPPGHPVTRLLFTPSTVAGNSIIISGHGLVNGTAVTYDAPEPLTFSSRQVDVELFTGSPGTCDDPSTPDIIEDCLIDVPTRNNILFLDETGNPADHNLVSGDLVLYGVTGVCADTPVAIGPLVSGRVYLVRRLTSTEIHLQPTTTTSVEFVPAAGSGDRDRIVRIDDISWVDAGLNAGDLIAITGSLSNNGAYTIQSVDGSTLTLTTSGSLTSTIATAKIDGPVRELVPDKSDARAADIHTLIKTTDLPITGLVEGQTYYVTNATGNTFQLAETPGGAPITFSADGLDADIQHRLFESKALALSYEWDLDNDGVFESTGESVIFSAVGVDGPSSSTPNVRATDASGVSAIAAATVNVQNVAPVVTAGVNQTAPKGVAVDIALGSFSDPGPDAPWTVRVDWGDGSAATIFNRPVTGALPPTAHTYAETGAYTVTTTVTDKDGGSGMASLQVAIANVVCCRIAITVNPTAARRGQTVYISGTVTNSSTMSQNVTLQFELTSPVKGKIGSFPLTLPANTNQTKTLPFRIPAGAPLGTYTLKLTTVTSTGAVEAFTTFEVLP